MTKKNGKAADKESISLETRAVADLRPHPKNPNRHPEAQLEGLDAAVEEFGFASAIVVDDKGTILAGEGRWLTARRKQIPEVPALVVRGWSEDKKLAFLLADNQLARLSMMDDEALREALRHLKDNEFPLDALGFDDRSLVEAMSIPEAPTEAVSFEASTDTEQHQCPRCLYRWKGDATPPPLGAKGSKKKAATRAAR